MAAWFSSLLDIPMRDSKWERLSIIIHYQHLLVTISLVTTMSASAQAELVYQEVTS